MNCVKCGRETGQDQAFCAACLEDMERHPVRPGTVVLLPNLHAPAVQKKPAPRKRPMPSAEEQVVTLKKKVFWLRLLAFFMALVIGGLAFITSRVITELDIQRLLGQNYSTVETADTPTEPAST